MNWFISSKQNEAKKLIPLLADASKRDHAARELMRMASESVPLLLEALQTQDANLLLIYQHLLARIPAASPLMAQALTTAHPLVRGRIAEVFSISKDKTAVPALLTALRGEYYTVRSRAALALGHIGDESAIPALLTALKDREDEVRIAACEALGQFKDPDTFDELANVLLDDPKIEVRQAAVKVLGETRHPAAIPFLMESLRDSFWWFEREQSVQDLLNAIENMGEPVVEPLIEALGDREGTVRKFAAMILGKLRDVRAMEELGMTLYDLHHEVSQAAAEALAHFGGEAVDTLSEALRHPEAAVREHAVMGLGKIQDARVAPLLIAMLNDPERIVKWQVVKSLGGLPDDRAKSALQEVAANRADRELSNLAKQILQSE